MRDRAQVEEVIAAVKPELVFHAAALKHLPMVEANPIEGVLTNDRRPQRRQPRAVRGLAGGHDLDRQGGQPVERDGRDKRIAEAFCQALDLYEAAEGRGRRRTRYVTVRFGMCRLDRIGGAAVPASARRRQRSPSESGVSRYFMTVREAVELVLQSSALPSGGAPETAARSSCSTWASRSRSWTWRIR